MKDRQQRSVHVEEYYHLSPLVGEVEHDDTLPLSKTQTRLQAPEYPQSPDSFNSNGEFTSLLNLSTLGVTKTEVYDLGSPVVTSIGATRVIFSDVTDERVSPLRGSVSQYDAAVSCNV